MRIVKKQPLNNGVTVVMAKYNKKYLVTWGATGKIDNEIPTDREFCKGESDKRCAPPRQNWPLVYYKKLTYAQAAKRFAQLVEALPTMHIDWSNDLD